MMTFIFGLVLLAVLLVALSAQKTYSYVPIKELRRQARKGDELAKILYGAVSYGFGLRAFLWLVIGASAAGSFMLLQLALPGWLTFIGLVFLLLFAFMWLPQGRVSAWSVRVVAYVTPWLIKVLQFAHPVFDRVTTYVNRHRPLTIHTGLYEREDIVQLLQDQALQTDNRIEPADLRLAEQALTFGDKIVRETMTPRRIVRSVKPTAAIGPVLLDELHESGHSRFPVYDDAGLVIGVLYLHDIIGAGITGLVADRMRREVFYVHEDHTLRQVLHAFLQTKRHLFVVVNEFEEYVGIISVEDVLEQILGEPIIDEFDRYDDMRAVAASLAAADHKDHKKQETVVD